MDVKPSPKFQLHALALSDESAKLTLKGPQPLVADAENAVWNICIFCFVMVDVHPRLSVIVSVTGPEGIDVNTCVGFCKADVFPSPKSHSHDAALVLESVYALVTGKRRSGTRSWLQWEILQRVL